MGMSYRRLYYETHSWGLGFYSNTIPDTIASLNPAYFGDGRTKQQFVSIQYNFLTDHRDIAFYPLRGYYLNLSASKLGITPLEDVNIFVLQGDAAIFKHIGYNFFASASLSQKVSGPTEQPYIYARSLGYGSAYVSGYELYVIDGQHHTLLKTNLRKKVWGFEKTFRWIPIKQFQTTSLKIYLRVFSDAGMAVDNSKLNVGNKPLANQLLWGNGVGIDLVSYYDTVLRFEYTINRMLETGFYIHYRSML
jgi:outer membrane protein assembly factor BamA